MPYSINSWAKPRLLTLTSGHCLIQSAFISMQGPHINALASLPLNINFRFSLVNLHTPIKLKKYEDSVVIIFKSLRRLCLKLCQFRWKNLSSLEEVAAFVQAQIARNGQMQGHKWLNLHPIQKGYVVLQDRIRRLIKLFDPEAVELRLIWDAGIYTRPFVEAIICPVRYSLKILLFWVHSGNCDFFVEVHDLKKIFLSLTLFFKFWVYSLNLDFSKSA